MLWMAVSLPHMATGSCSCTFIIPVMFTGCLNQMPCGNTYRVVLEGELLVSSLEIIWSGLAIYAQYLIKVYLGLHPAFEHEEGKSAKHMRLQPHFS